MTVVALDTHEVVKELKAAGFTDEQAEAVTRVVRDAQNIGLSHLATKVDVLAVQADLQAAKADLQAAKFELQADLQVRLAETKTDILEWMVSSMGAQTVVILGTVIALMRMMR